MQTNGGLVFGSVIAMAANSRVVSEKGFIDEGRAQLYAVLN